MLNKLLDMIRRYEMVKPGDRVICAVSGGADSVALLLAMYLLKEKLDIRLEATHFNHKLRGEESERDEKFVRDLCDRYDIPLHIGSKEVRPGKKGLEAAAREARYAFFATLDGKIATAHTADDNAETVLMHLIRGTGLKGLGGISPVRDNLIRPMLLVTRNQVLDFLDEYHQPYVEDSTNETDAFLRNRLRHRVMPLLREENPRINENLSSMAMRLRLDEEALNQNLSLTDGLDIEALRQMHPARRNRVLDAFLKNAGVKEPDAANIAQAEALAFSENPSAKAGFPGGITIVRRYNKLLRQQSHPPIIPMKLSCPGVTELEELGLRIWCGEADTIINTPTVFTVHPRGDLIVRSRRTGDTLTLPGGTKTLKKILIDRKIPADCRDSIPVLEDQQGILGVYGIGPDRKRSAQALPAVQIRIERMEPEEKNNA